jgi:hypothetical protein
MVKNDWVANFTSLFSLHTFAMLLALFVLDCNTGGYLMSILCHDSVISAMMMWCKTFMWLSNTIAAGVSDIYSIVVSICHYFGAPTWLTWLAVSLASAFVAYYRRYGVSTREWHTYGKSRIHYFTVLKYPKECNFNEINSMAHAGFTAFREVQISIEALNWLKFQKTNKPTNFTQQQFADLLLKEFAVGRADHDILFDTASFHHQLLISKHWMFKLQEGTVEEQIERM